MPPGDSWRKCWICDVRVYKAHGKRKDDPPATSAWVSIDLADGLIVGLVRLWHFASSFALGYNTQNSQNSG